MPALMVNAVQLKLKNGDYDYITPLRYIRNISYVARDLAIMWKNIPHVMIHPSEDNCISRLEFCNEQHQA